MGESSSGTVASSLTCSEPECADPGQWRPVIHVYDERGGKVPGEVVLPNLVVCGAHKEEATKDIIESCWDEIVSAFSGWRRGKLVREKTQILYEPI